MPGYFSAMRVRNKFVLAVGATLLVISQGGCLFSGVTWHPAYIVAVALPDSIRGNEPMTALVYTFRSDCTVETEAASFIALSDSLFEVRVQQSEGTPGVGCPGGIWPGTFRLARAPSRRFHVRFVGANTVNVVVQGGTRPASGVRETFRFGGGRIPASLLDSLSVLLVRCHAEAGGYVRCSDTLAVVRADSSGTAVFEGPCALDGVPYYAEARYLAHQDDQTWYRTFIELRGQFHCTQPAQIVVPDIIH